MKRVAPIAVAFVVLGCGERADPPVVDRTRTPPAAPAATPSETGDAEQTAAVSAGSPASTDTKVEPQPYPDLHCAFGDSLSGRWVIHVDPQGRKAQRRVERLLDAHPKADGVARGLSRKNLPEELRELSNVTLISERGVTPTTVTNVGIRPSPSDGRYVFLLAERMPDDEAFAVAVAGTLRAGVAWAPIEPDGATAKLVPNGAVDLEAWLRADLGREQVPREPSAKFEAVARFDLDGDGLDEVVVHEHWPEGLFVWLVRYDADKGALVGRLLCGDAN